MKEEEKKGPEEKRSWQRCHRSHLDATVRFEHPVQALLLRGSRHVSLLLISTPIFRGARPIVPILQRTIIRH